VTVTELIAVATKLAVPFAPSDDCSSGDVAAALITTAGHVFTGVCLDTECGLGFCAEHSAIAEMLKARECQIEMIVAVDHRGQVMSPCGRCRELIWQVADSNRDTMVVLGPEHCVRLVDLLPFR
jgi:cytidine deaminase